MLISGRASLGNDPTTASFFFFPAGQLREDFKLFHHNTTTGVSSVRLEPLSENFVIAHERERNTTDRLSHSFSYAYQEKA